MDLYEGQRNYQPFFKDGKEIAQIDRTFSDDVSVKLSCGYYARFWMNLTNEEAVKRAIKLKNLKL